MKKRGLFLAICAMTALALNVGAQTKRRYDEIMKDVNSTYATLKRNLDTQNAEAGKDAVKLQTLFKEVEEFWAPFDTKDATDAAQGAQTAFVALSESVKVNNFQQALTTYTAAGRYCAACHTLHRVQAADQSYVIKP